MGKMRKIKGLVKSFIKDERGVGTVEIILIFCGFNCFGHHFQGSAYITC